MCPHPGQREPARETNPGREVNSNFGSSMEQSEEAPLYAASTPGKVFVSTVRCSILHPTKSSDPYQSVHFDVTTRSKKDVHT